MSTRIKLKIAEIIIEFQSDFPLETLTEEERDLYKIERFQNFFYEGEANPYIIVHIDIVDRFPRVSRAAPIFTSYHFEDGSENWRLSQKGDSFFFQSRLKGREQVMEINPSFDRVSAYVKPHKTKGRVWKVPDLLYDFLQVLLIHYLAQENQGIVTHSIGIKDLNGLGLLFAGKSGSGKTTMAKLWYEHSKAMVLNDDRVIIRKKNGKYFIHGSPWHGDFSDYLYSRIEAAPLERLFFIHHAKKNRAQPLGETSSFSTLYPSTFPPFWNKECLENMTSFCLDLVKNVDCYSFGFLNDKNLIPFVREI